MVDEDTVAPRLADADLQEHFAELQHVLQMKDEAIAKAEQLSNAKPGDEVYDDILEDVSGSSRTWKTRSRRSSTSWCARHPVCCFRFRV